MQVTPLPAPVLPTATTQDVVTKAVSAVQAQASAPVTQRAIDPSQKSDRGGQSRSNSDRAKGGAKSPAGDETIDRGGSLNIRV